MLITGGFQKARMAEPDRNYIIIPVCLPDSQTQLSVVITDAVKIYDLASGVLSPAYCLLVNSGKIRDVVFVHNDSGLMHLLLISSAGHVFFQQLRDESSARHGSFSVTNIMDLPPRSREELWRKSIKSWSLYLLQSHPANLVLQLRPGQVLLRTTEASHRKTFCCLPNPGRIN